MPGCLWMGTQVFPLHSFHSPFWPLDQRPRTKCRRNPAAHRKRREVHCGHSRGRPCVPLESWAPAPGHGPEPERRPEGRRQSIQGLAGRRLVRRRPGGVQPDVAVEAVSRPAPPAPARDRLGAGASEEFRKQTDYISIVFIHTESAHAGALVPVSLQQGPSEEEMDLQNRQLIWKKENKHSRVT